MARNEITFQVNLKKDTNSASRTYGMYFGEAESKEPLNQDHGVGSSDHFQEPVILIMIHCCLNSHVICLDK